MSQSKEAMKRIYASLLLAELAWRDDLEEEKTAMAKSFTEINFNTKPNGYAVFVWSMKSDKCDFDRLILVRRTSTCIEAQALKMSARKKRLSKWGKNEKIQCL